MTVDGSAPPVPGVSARTSAAARLLYVVSILGPLVLFAAGATLDRSLTLARAKTDLISVLDILTEHAERVLDTHAVLIAAAEAQLSGHSVEAIRADAHAIHERLAALKAEAEGVVAIVGFSEDGRAIVDSGQFPTRPVDVADRPFFQAVREQSGRLILSEPMESRGYPGRRILVLARRSEKTPLVLSVGMPDSYLTEFWRDTIHGSGAATLLVRQDGKILVRNPPIGSDNPVTLDANSPLMTAIAEGRERTALTNLSPVDGERRMIGYRQVGELPIYIGHALSMDEVLEPWRDRMVVYSGVTGLLVSFLGILILWNDRRARTIDGLATTLQASERSLQTLNAELEARVTERTRALEDALASKDLLMREVHHRVMNSLSMAASLVRLQRRSLGDSAAAAAALGETEQRIAALGRVHERLAQSRDIQTVPMGPYLASLVDDVSSLSGAIRVTCRVEDFTLPADRAVKLGIVATELVINALKHAFAVGVPGEVVVSAQATPDGFRLTVDDDGRGFDTEGVQKRPSGFGMTVVEALARDLRATVVRERRERGSSFIVEGAPAPPAPGPV